MIRVQAEDFDVGAELAALGGNPRIGGLCCFVGLVRDFMGSDGPGTAMTLEHYPGMTERRLAALDAEARRRWPLEAVTIIHRFGRLEIGDRIVLVATASAHREAAFQSCHFVMDWLKTKAPFWKLEHSGQSEHWVEAQERDTVQAERWRSS